MDNKIWNCIIKRLSDEETEESKYLLDNWIIADAAHEEKYKEVKSLWELTGELPLEAYNGFDEVRQRILTGSEHQLPKPAGHRFWKYGLAAAMTGMFLLAVFFYYKPGKPATAQDQWIVKRAEAGSTLSIVLPDNSKVWLNSGSELSFQSEFGRDKARLVKLNGEGYFEVAHDSAHPFVVKSGKLSTTVYGTSFNVRAYENERVSTVSVNSGRVGVMASAIKAAVFLLPKDKLTYDKKNDEITKATVNLDDVNPWLQGELIFEQSPLNEVFAALSRKYDMKIETGKTSYEGCRLTARFKNKSITEVMRTLKLSMNIQSKSVGKTIYIEGGNCM